MRVHLTVRALAYSAVAAAATVVALFGLSIYLRGLTVPQNVLNWRVAQRTAARYGVRYRLDSFRIGCLTAKCSGEGNAGALDIEFQTPEPIRFHLNSAQWRRSGPLTAAGLEIRLGDRAPLIEAEGIEASPASNQGSATGLRIGLSPGVAPSEIGDVEFDGASKRLAVNRIQVRMEDRPPVTVDRVQLDGWTFPAADGGLGLDHMEVDGVTVSLDGNAGSATVCERLPSSAAISRQAAPFRPLLPLLRESVAKLRSDLLRLALLLAAAVLLLKFLSVLWLRGWVARLLLAVVPAVLPFILYFRLHETWSTGKFLLVSAGILLAVALMFRVFVYGRAGKWYQRWEPFASDLTSAIILVPLLGYGLQLPPPPAAPQGLRLDRLDVANIAGRSETGTQFDIPRTAVLGTSIVFPNTAGSVFELRVAAVEIAAAAMTPSTSSRLMLEDTRIDGVSVAYDPAQVEIRDVAAHVRLGGSLESDSLQRELQNLEFLRGVQTRVNRIGFDFDLKAAGPDVFARISQQFPESRNPIAVNAVVNLKPADCTATYDLLARVSTSPMMLMARADGDLHNVNIRELRSLPDSPLQIAEGSGSVSLNADGSRIRLNLRSIGGAIGGSPDAAQLSLDSLGVSASLPSSGTSGPQNVSLELGPARMIRPSGEMEIRFAKARMGFDRTPAASLIPVRFQTSIEDVHVERQGGGIIEADFPLVETALEGSTTPGIIPHTFNGTAFFRVSGSGTDSELIGTDKPLSVRLDLWKGLLEVPAQQITLREAVISQNRVEIPVQLELSGQLSAVVPQPTASFRAQAETNHVEQTLGTAQFSVDGIRLESHAEWNDRGFSGKVNYSTGLIHTTLPPGPTGFCVDEISMLQLQVAGKASRLPALGNVPPATASSTCAALPASPEQIRFRLSGVYPPGPQESALRLEGGSAKGILVRDVHSEIGSLQIRGGRLAGTQTRVIVTGVQNLEGRGGFDIRADLRQGSDSFAADSRILAPDGVPLLESSLVRTPDRIALEVTQQEPVDRILAQLRPFLSDLKMDLGGITSQARLTRLQAEANFDSDGALHDAFAAAELTGGSIASIERPDLHLNLATTPAGPGPSFRLNIGAPEASLSGTSRSIVAMVSVPQSSITADTKDDVAMNVEGNVRLEASGLLLMSGDFPANPVLEKVFEVGRGLSQDSSRLAGILGTGSAPAPARNIEWHLNLPQNAAGQPAIEVASSEIRVNLPTASFEAAWDGADREERSKIAGSSALEAAFSLEGDGILLDALAPVQLAITLSGDPETRVESNLPIQVAFSDRLREGRSQADSLWDEDYYRAFWGAHPSRFAGTEVISPVNIGEATFGPLLVRQVLFPVEPIRAVVGYADALQVGLPLSGRALYGTVGATLESNMIPSADAVSMDVRLTIDLKNIQAAALEAMRGGSYSAIVEDELDGRIFLRFDGLTVDRDMPAVLLAGKAAPDELRKIGMSVHMFRSPEAVNTSGVLQASSDLRLNLVNDVLNGLVKGLRISGPPRALTYRDLDMKFEVVGGQVRTDGDILRLDGLQIFTADLLDVDGKVRAHLGRPGERVLLRDMIEMLSVFTDATNTEAR